MKRCRHSKKSRVSHAKYGSFTAMAAMFLLFFVIFMLASCGQKHPVNLPGDEETKISSKRDERNQEGSEETAVLTKTDAMSLPAEKKVYTLMVYMIGSDLESRYASATSDIEEMEAAGVDYTKNNVLIYAGGSRRWNNDIPAGNNSILDLSLDKDHRIVASTAISANMAAPETLSDFINFARENYPAEHYGIIFWDHGAGPLWGYGSDELFDHDTLSLEEMAKAMEMTAFDHRNKLDFVGFDACLMGSLETMTIWSEYADYYIGSEELEPGAGWNYDFLSILNETDDTKIIVQKIVERYGAYYEAAKTKTSDPDVTLACANLSKAAQVQTALASLSEEMAGDLSQGAYAQLWRDRAEAKSFGLVENSKGETFAYDLMDLGDFAEVISESYPKQSRQIKEAVEALIIAQYSNIAGTSGVAIYYPYGNKAQFNEMSSAYNALDINGQYSDFLMQFTQTWLRSAGRDWKIPQAQIGEDEISLQLPEEMMAHTTGVYYYVIEDMGEGSYYPIVMRAKVTPDQEGRLTLTTDPELLCIKADTGEKEIWPVYHLESGKDRVVWGTYNLKMTSNVYFGFEMSDETYEDVDILIRQEIGSNQLTIQSISSDDGEAALGSKNTLDMSHYEGIYWGFRELLPTRDKKGRLLPVTQWYNNGISSYDIFPVDQESLSFETTKASDQLGRLHYQIVLEDDNGEAYASELIPITPVNRAEVVSEKTESGTIKYAIYKDHAEVYDYIGQDTKVAVKEEIKGRKVTAVGENAFGRIALFMSYDHNVIEEIALPDTITEIGSSAFSNCQELKEIKLPKHLTSIGASAFAGCSSLKTIDIPDSVETIGKGAFSYCEQLEKAKLPKNISVLGTQIFMRTALREIVLDEANTHFKVREDTLLSADGKTAYAAVLRDRDSLKVPEGVETIASGAFYGPADEMKKIKKITLPKTLKVIGNYAFGDMSLAGAPKLPKGLESIGMYAFNAGDYSLMPEEVPKKQSEIYIGKNVKYIGSGAFDMFTNRRFKVSKKNPYFAESGGCLTNKAKDTLTALAYEGLGEMVIPEGILSFDLNLLEVYEIIGILNLDQVDVFFPESVDHIDDGDAEIIESVFIFHCSQDSAAYDYAKRHGIEVSLETEIKRGETQVKTLHGTMTFDLFESHASLVRYEGRDAAIEVPKNVKGLNVTTIGNGFDAVAKEAGAAAQETDENGESAALLEITLPQTVTILQNNAFKYMSLTKMNMPEHLEYLGDQAMPSGIDIKALPDSVAYMGSECIGSSSDFSENGFTLPSSLKYMAPDALKKCYIKEFRLKGENAYYSVVEGALYSKDGKTLICWPNMREEALIPDGVEMIGPMAFKGANIKCVVIPDSVTEIGENAFEYCWYLENADLGEGIVNIGAHAFSGCDALEKIILPGSVRSIGRYCFAFCDHLKQVKLNEGLKSMGEYMLYGSEEIEEISLPDSLFGAADYALGAAGTAAYIPVKEDTLLIGSHFSSLGDAGLSALKAQNFEVAYDNTSFAAVDGWLTDASGSVLLACPAGRAGAVEVPDGIYRIEGFAFYGCLEVTDIYIPDSVKSISSLAFDDELYQTWVSGSDTETSGFVKNREVIIHCSEDSAAEQYCKNEKRTYVIE